MDKRRIDYFMVRELANRGDFGEAIKKARSMGDKMDNVSMLCIISEEMAYAGMKEKAITLLNEAIDMAEEIDDEFDYSLAMSKISLKMAIAGEINHALKITGNIGLESERAYSMIKIFNIVRSKEVERAIKILQDAESVVNEMENDINKITLITEIAYAFKDIGMLGKAWNAIENAKKIAEKFDEESASYAYSLIAQSMLDYGNTNGAMALIDNISNIYDKIWLLADIASVMADFEDVDNAKKLMEKCINMMGEMEDGAEKAKAFAEISYVMFEIGDRRYEKMLDKVKEILESEMHELDVIEIYPEIARVIIYESKFDDAINFIEEIEDEDTKIDCYESLFNDLIYDGREKEAKKIREPIRKIFDKYWMERNEEIKDD